MIPTTLKALDILRAGTQEFTFGFTPDAAVPAARPPIITTAPRTGAGGSITVNAPKLPETVRRTETAVPPASGAGVMPRQPAATLRAGASASTPSASTMEATVAVAISSLLLLIILLGLADRSK